MRDYYKGEKRTICVEVKRKKKKPFSIEYASYVVQDRDGKTVQEGQASVDGTKVMFLMDTTLPGYTDDRSLNPYRSWFEVNIADEGNVLIEAVAVKIQTGVKL